MGAGGGDEGRDKGEDGKDREAGREGGGNSLRGRGTYLGNVSPNQYYSG